MPHDNSRGGRLRPGLPEAAGSVAAGAATSSYQASLLRIIESIEKDPAQLRRLVYDLARMKLGREIEETTLTPVRVRECIRALETAISRVESDLSCSELADVSFPLLPGDPLCPEPADAAPEPPAASSPRLRVAAESQEERPARLVRAEAEAARSRGAVPTPLRPHQRWPKPPEPTILPSAAPPAPRTERPQVEIVYPEREHPDVLRNRRRVWRWLMVWPLAQLAGAVALSAVLFLALTGRLHESPPPVTSAGREEPAVTPSGLPLPASYGVYAISGGQLKELEALPIKAPNPRVALSAEIIVPSKTLLPDGHVVFVAFRRELVNNAPEKASIRVVARVAHAMTFVAGKPSNANLQTSWRIRSNSYEFNVAPLSESREMVSIKPDTTDFALPAGRYALVLNGAAYDFMVDGPVTDRAQCLESVMAIDGLVYSECGKK
jgi:hypothetical protein